VEADAFAAIGMGGAVIVGKLRGVGEQHQALPGYVAAFVLHLFEIEADAFFGQQPGDERVIGFAVLAAVTARTGMAEEGFRFLGHPPVVARGVRREDFFDDVQDAFVLEHARCASLRRHPEPRHEGQPISREAAIAAELGDRRDITGACALRAVGQASAQSDLLAQQAFELNVRVAGKAIDVVLIQGRQLFLADKAFDQQRVWEGRIKLEQTCLRREA
jgi:hypothetical protein